MVARFIPLPLGVAKISRAVSQRRAIKQRCIKSDTSLAVDLVTIVALLPHTPLYIRRRKIDQSTPQTFHHPPSHIRLLFRGKK